MLPWELSKVQPDAVLNLNELDRGLPGITPTWGTAMVEAAVVCLTSQGHSTGVYLSTEGCSSSGRTLSWMPLADAAQASRTWADTQEATEYGATAIAVLLIKAETGYKVVERSGKGTGIDYWMGDDTAVPRFQRKARLEISGILNAHGAAPQVVASRVGQKLQQVVQSSSPLDAYVVVVEFGMPLAKVQEL